MSLPNKYVLRWVATSSLSWRKHGTYYYHGGGLGIYENPKRAHMTARRERNDKVGYWEIIEIELTPINIISAEQAKE